MNTCRICWKEIWPKYTDKVLRCSKCRAKVDEKIWMKDNYVEIDVPHLEDELFAWKQMYKKLRDWVKEHCNNCPYV